jgi:hypothetical protein
VKDFGEGNVVENAILEDQDMHGRLLESCCENSSLFRLAYICDFWFSYCYAVI